MEESWTLQARNRRSKAARTPRLSQWPRRGAEQQEINHGSRGAWRRIAGWCRAWPSAPSAPCWALLPCASPGCSMAYSSCPNEPRLGLGAGSCEGSAAPLLLDLLLQWRVAKWEHPVGLYRRRRATKAHVLQVAWCLLVHIITSPWKGHIPRQVARTLMTLQGTMPPLDTESMPQLEIWIYRWCLVGL
jgi:hypothetical protein